jgi:plasmid maintenance system antidote protein VapI
VASLRIWRCAFEAALGASAQFWLSAQTAWDLWHQLHSPQATEVKKIERVNAA